MHVCAARRHDSRRGTRPSSPRGQFDLAIADYDSVLDKPYVREFAGYVMRAEAYSAKGDHARALADYENAITDIESDRSGYETQLARNTATLAVSSDLVAAIAGRDKARAAYSE